MTTLAEKAQRIGLLIYFATTDTPHHFIHLPEIENARAWLVDQGYLELEPVDAGEGETWLPTERGQVWVGMIVSTPEPVQSWADPRSLLAIRSMTLDTPLDRLELEIVPAAPAAKPKKPPKGKTMPPATPPAGFTPWEGKPDTIDNKPIPPTNESDIVEVAWRKGARAGQFSTNPAGSFIWTWSPTDPRFDIIGYRVVEAAGKRE